MLKEVTIPIYDALVIFSVDKTSESLSKHLKAKFDINEHPVDCSGYVNSKFAPLYDARVFYMYILPSSTKKDYWNSIAHELFHLTQEILEDRQTYFKRKDPNEAYAYLQGYLMSENHDFWERAYKKFSTKKKITAG